MTSQESDATDPGEQGSADGVPARSPLTREQQLVVGRILVSKPLPFRPRPFRYEWASTFGGLAFIVVLVLSWIIWFLLGHRSSIGSFVAIGAGGNLILAIGVAPLVRRRARAFIRLHEGFICPTCHYPLGALPDEGQCPECATLYTRVQVVEMWKWTYKMKDRFPISGTHKSSTTTEPLV